MDPHALLSTLIYNQSTSHSAEGLARILGMVHLYRTSGLHFLAFFTFLEWSILQLLSVFRVEIKVRRAISLVACGSAIYWIWSLQAFRPTLLRPIATFLVRLFFRHRGAIARVALPLVFTFLIEWVALKNPFLTPFALHYYLAVGGGLFAWEASKEKNIFIQHLFLALGSWLPIALVDLWQDHLVSYATPIYSFFSLPVITYFLYPLTLASLLFRQPVPEWILSCWSDFLDALWLLPEHAITFASVSRSSVYLSLALAIGISTLIELRRRYRFKFVHALLFLVFLLSIRLGATLMPVSRQVIQFDVGQGDAALLRANLRTEMIDLGSFRQLKTEEWLRKLTRYQIIEINSVLFSHLDEDHVGGIRHLLTAVKIDCVETNAALWSSEKGTRLNEDISTLSPETQKLTRGCMRLVEPHWFESHGKSAGGNELMAGVVFELSPKSAYFALGDGDQEQELQYESVYANEILQHQTRYLKISHHGSKFSSGLEFLERMHAKEYWISAGKHNHYHHPNPLTLLRLQTVGGTIHRTDVEGDLSSVAE